MAQVNNPQIAQALLEKIVLRISDKQWIKSICGSSENKTTRLILIK